MARKYTKYPSKAADQIKLIRRIIKAKCPTLSVRMGKGTSWGWVDISSKNIGARFTKNESSCLKSLGMTPGGNWDLISPADRPKFIEKHMAKRAGIKLSNKNWKTGY